MDCTKSAKFRRNIHRTIFDLLCRSLWQRVKEMLNFLRWYKHWQIQDGASPAMDPMETISHRHSQKTISYARKCCLYAPNVTKSYRRVACTPDATGGTYSQLLSAIVRLLLPARDSGTVYLSTSSLPRHSQHFVRN